MSCRLTTFGRILLRIFYLERHKVLYFKTKNDPLVVGVVRLIVKNLYTKFGNKLFLQDVGLTSIIILLAF